MLCRVSVQLATVTESTLSSGIVHKIVSHVAS